MFEKSRSRVAVILILCGVCACGAQSGSLDRVDAPNSHGQGSSDMATMSAQEETSEKQRLSDYMDRVNDGDPNPSGPSKPSDTSPPTSTEVPEFPIQFQPDSHEAPISTAMFLATGFLTNVFAGHDTIVYFGESGYGPDGDAEQHAEVWVEVVTESGEIQADRFISYDDPSPLHVRSLADDGVVTVYDDSREFTIDLVAIVKDMVR